MVFEACTKACQWLADLGVADWAGFSTGTRIQCRSASRERRSSYFDITAEILCSQDRVVFRCTLRLCESMLADETMLRDLVLAQRLDWPSGSFTHPKSPRLGPHPLLKHALSSNGPLLDLRKLAAQAKYVRAPACVLLQKQLCDKVYVPKAHSYNPNGLTELESHRRWQARNVCCSALDSPSPASSTLLLNL